MINLPTTGTPTEQMSTDIVPLKISTLGSSSTKVTMVLHYGDPKLDEEIVIPSYDSKTMNLDQIYEVQEVLERRKKQEILKNEYRQKKALVEIKDIFLDAFTLQVPDETKHIMEQVSNIVD